MRIREAMQCDPRRRDRRESMARRLDSGLRCRTDCARRCRSGPRPTYPAGPARQARGFGSSTIFTGTRCTTLVKLPVALSGGSRAKVLPVPGDQLSTWPVSTRSGNASTVTRARIADPDIGHLGFLVIRDDPDVRQRDRGDHLRADIDELPGRTWRCPTIPSTGERMCV